MGSSIRNNKHELGFHIFILLFAIGVVVSSIVGASELDNRGTMYLTLGTMIGFGSLYQIYKIAKRTKRSKESLNT